MAIVLQSLDRDHLHVAGFGHGCLFVASSSVGSPSDATLRRPSSATLSRSHPHNPSHPSSVVMGNSSTLLVTSVGDSVLVAPHIIQNLLSIHRFTTDNSFSIALDPFGLFVKDLATRTLLA